MGRDTTHELRLQLDRSVTFAVAHSVTFDVVSSLIEPLFLCLSPAQSADTNHNTFGCVERLERLERHWMATSLKDRTGQARISRVHSLRE